MNTSASLALLAGLSLSALCGAAEHYSQGQDGFCIDSSQAEYFGIEPVARSAPKAYRQNYCKYVALQAPNGKLISIYAQDEITDEQMIRAANILDFYLTDLPASQYGFDKQSVFNTMANNGATLILMNGSDDGSNDPAEGVGGQPLYATELVVEGSQAYINNDYENHRDAAFEEILHLVHDYGIGTTGGDDFYGALPGYAAMIDQAMSAVMAASLWPTANADEGTQAWIEELREEGSLSQEYLASVIDSYYGYWGASEEPGGMWGIYQAKTRDDVEQLDPLGAQLVEAFFSPQVTYMARIDSEFMGSFSLTFDEAYPYTHKSRYLQSARLTGELDSNLIGNQEDNFLAGNAGANLIDGREGADVVLFEGDIEDYEIDIFTDKLLVEDRDHERDGLAILVNVEGVVFGDELFVLHDQQLLELYEYCLVPGQAKTRFCTGVFGL